MYRLIYIYMFTNWHIFECVCVCTHIHPVSHVWLFVNLWSVACQAPLSMGLSGLEYCSGLPFPLQGIFLTQRLNVSLLHLLHGSWILLPLSHLVHIHIYMYIYIGYICTCEISLCQLRYPRSHNALIAINKHI